MTKTFLFPLFLLCVAACAADAQHEAVGATEEADAASGALEDMADDSAEMGLAASPSAVEAIGSVLTPEEQIQESLTSWRVYKTCRSPTDAEPILVAIRLKDWRNVRSWVYLDLEEHWLHGDEYFEELMKRHHLTVLDMVGIFSAMQEVGDDSPAVGSRPMPKAAMPPQDGCYECTPDSGTPWIPMGPDSDHRGGPPPSGAQPSSSGGGVHVGGPPPSWPGVPGSQLHPSPTPEEIKKKHAWDNGLRPGDPAARPSPFDSGYTPKPRDVKEDFKCEGEVLHGYKAACIDFQKMSMTHKWTTKLESWWEKPSFYSSFTTRDWTLLCEVSSLFVGAASCSSAMLACGTAETITLGSVTVPCAGLLALYCAGGPFVTGLLTTHCSDAVNLK